MQEIELKFLVADNKVEALLRQTKIKSSATQQLAAHYFDTPEHHLAKNGAAIRIRKEGDNWVQTLKTSGDGMAARFEHNHMLDNATIQQNLNDNSIFPDLSVYENTPIAEVITNFKVKKLSKSLTRQYVTDVTRTTRLIKKEGSVIEVAYDEGEVVHGLDSSKRSSIHEIEFELHEGELTHLFEVARTWCKRYKLCLSTVTKAERGSLLVADKPYADAVKSDLKQLAVDKDMSQQQFMRAVVHNCVLQILPNASAIAAGSEDGNHVHQLRVGIRRLRTALKFFAAFSARINPDWTPILKQTFSLLGEFRDREILEIKTQPLLEEEGAPFVDWSIERNSLKVMPIDAVRANDFQLTLLELIEYSMTYVKTEDNEQPLAQDAVSQIMDQLFKKIAKASEHFADLDIESQHDVRKRLKSLRYISEFAAPMFKSQKTKKLLKYLEPAQEILGEYNDSLVGQAFYTQKAQSDPNAWFAVGYFTAEKHHAAAHCATSLKTIKDAPKFW